MKTKFITILAAFSISFSSHAFNSKPLKDLKQNQPFEIQPLNSPVKTSNADFQIIAPANFQVDKLKVRLVKAHDLHQKSIKLEVVQSAGGKFSVGVSKLPPGFYRLFVIAIDKKSGKETPYKNQFHDYVRFVIDESMEVPVPDPKINNSTLTGIDTDKNGIRDDIQRFINEKYNNDPDQKMAAKQYATTQQLLLETHKDKLLNRQAMLQHLDASMCWSGLKGAIATEKEVSFLKTRFLDTKERFFAEKESNWNFHGQGGTIPENKLQFCSFK